jgi:hypothetical protein
MKKYILKITITTLTFVFVGGLVGTPIAEAGLSGWKERRSSNRRPVVTYYSYSPPKAEPAPPKREPDPEPEPRKVSRGPTAAEIARARKQAEERADREVEERAAEKALAEKAAAEKAAAAANAAAARWQAQVEQAENEIQEKMEKSIAVAYAAMAASDKQAIADRDAAYEPEVSTCGGTTGIRCGEEPSWDDYYPGQDSNTKEYNALWHTEEGTGWWTAGNTGNSGYTVNLAKDANCENGAQNGYKCMEVKDFSNNSVSFIYVNDVRFANLQRAAQDWTGYGESSIFSLTTTSFNCSGCTCYDNGWRDCSTAPPDNVKKDVTLSVYAPTAPDGGVEPTPNCVDYAPGKPSLVFPPNNAVVSLDEVDLQWDQSEWGKNCSGGGNEQYVILEKREKGTSAF